MILYVHVCVCDAFDNVLISMFRNKIMAQKIIGHKDWIRIFLVSGLCTLIV